MATRPTEAELEYQGIVSAKSRYANITLTFLDVGIQMFMCLYGLSVFLETHKALRKGRARFIVLSFMIWILSAIPASIDSWVNFEDLLAAGPSGIELQKQASKPPAGHRWIAPLNQILLLLYITLGEALMIWRCFIIWRDRRWVVIAPLLTCLATVALSITAAVALTPSGVNIRWTLRLVASRILLSVLTNILVTSLIIFKLVYTRRVISRALPHEKKPKMYTDVLAILIESAAPVAIFGILLAISFFNIALVQRRPIPRAHWAIFNDVTSLFYYSFCALSPQMIIFRVTTGRSWTSARDSGTAGSGVFSQPIYFARPEDGQEDLESSRDTRSFVDQRVLDEKGKAREL